MYTGAHDINKSGLFFVICVCSTRCSLWWNTPPSVFFSQWCDPLSGTELASQGEIPKNLFSKFLGDISGGILEKLLKGTYRIPAEIIAGIPHVSTATSVDIICGGIARMISIRILGEISGGILEGITGKMCTWIFGDPSKPISTEILEGSHQSFIGKL